MRRFGTASPVDRWRPTGGEREAGTGALAGSRPIGNATAATAPPEVAVALGC